MIDSIPHTACFVALTTANLIFSLPKVCLSKVVYNNFIAYRNAGDARVCANYRNRALNYLHLAVGYMREEKKYIQVACLVASLAIVYEYLNNKDNLSFEIAAYMLYTAFLQLTSLFIITFLNGFQREVGENPLRQLMMADEFKRRAFSYQNLM